MLDLAKKDKLENILINFVEGISKNENATPEELEALVGAANVLARLNESV